MANEFQIEGVYDSIEDLYLETKADMVIISVPELSTEEVCDAAFKFPWICLIEKPVGYNLENAEIIYKLSEKQKVEKVEEYLKKKFEYQEAQVLQILQQEVADDYVLSTNEFHSVKEFIEKAFSIKGIDIQWKGEGLEEIGYNKNNGKEIIFISKKYFRPSEVDELLGDSTKARNELNWIPKYSFDDLVNEMVENDTK